MDYRQSWQPTHDSNPEQNQAVLPDLTAADRAILAALLRETIAGDRFPLSPRVRRWQAILDKLESPAPKREPLWPLKPPGEPSMVGARMRGTKAAGVKKIVEKDDLLHSA